MASKIPLHSIRQPGTPSGKAHEEINKKIRDLNARWDLGLNARDIIWTPSKGQSTIEEQCIDRIKCLYYSAGTQLDALLLRRFPLLAQQTPSQERLPLLFRLLSELLPSGFPPKVRNQESKAKNRIYRQGDPELERASSTTEFNNVSPELIERTNNLFHRGARPISKDPEVEDLHARGHVVDRIIDESGQIQVRSYMPEQTNELEYPSSGPSELHHPVQDPTDVYDEEQILVEYEAEDRRLGLSEHAFGGRSKQPNCPQPSTPPASDTEEDDSDVFFSPPGSPTADAAYRQQAQKSPSMSSSTDHKGKHRCKRRSEGDNVSPPKRRISESTETNSAYHSPNPGLKPPPLMESFRSTGTRVESAMTSFAASTPGPSQDNVRQIESANTSFGSDMVGQGPSDEVISSPWGSSMPSLPPDLDNVITNQGWDEPVPFTRPTPKPNSVPSEGRVPTHTKNSLSTGTTTEMVEVAARSELRAARGSHQLSGVALRTLQEPMAGSSATAETMSTAEREALYDFTDMVVEQSFGRSEAGKRPSRTSTVYSAAATSPKDRTIRPKSPSPQRRQQSRPASCATTTTHEMQDSEMESPLRRLDSEDFRLSSLPKQHMFVNESNEPAVMSVMPFKTRYECSRVALASGLPIHAFATQAVLRITNYDDLWAYFKKMAKEKGVTLPKKGSAKAWDDISARCEYVNLKARLTFNDEANSRQSLFKLHIDPIEWEKPCRFQYAYGGDRFLYLFLPNLELKDDPTYLQQAHKPILIRRLQEWLDNEKSFLGRKWNVMHVEPVKEKSQAKRKKRLLSYRIILFATHGYDILPKMATWPSKTCCTEPSSSPETTIEEIVNWFMPLKKTAHQPYCKAFARFDLGITSSTFALRIH